MKRGTLLTIAVGFLAGPMLAQPAAAQTAKPLDPADVAALTGRPFGTAQQGDESKATQNASARRPLDWHDVDILTGKADREARARSTYASPYVSLDPYAGGSLYGRGQMTRLGRAASPLFFPFTFRSLGRGSFFFFGTRPFRPFFFGRGPRIHSIFFR